MKVLITGGAGFIGSHLADALATRGDSVVLLDDLSTGSLENVEHLLGGDSAQLVQGSVLDRELVDRCMADVDACFHLASAVGVQLICQRPLDTLLANVRGNDIVISSAVEHGKRLLFTSTSEVYGKNGSGPLHEDSDRVLGSPFKSRWSYATAKAFGEALAHTYARELGAETMVVRLFNTVGPRQSACYGMVLPRFVRQAIADEDLTVYGNGTQSRCFVHVEDTTRALVHLIETDEAIGNVYNVGSPDPVPIIELARRVIELADSESRIRLVSYEEAYDSGFEELGRRQPDTTALEELIGWRATRSLDETIEDVIVYERSRVAAADGEREPQRLTLAR